MFIIKYYLLGAVAAVLLALSIDQWFISGLLLWTAASLFLVCWAYYYDIPTIFRKTENGQIARWIRWAFIPFLFGAKLYNLWVRRNDTVPPIQKIGPGLFLSRRLLPNDVEELKANDITCIVDVTAEFAGLEGAINSGDFHYLTIPVLDHKTPSLDKLRHALNWIDAHRSLGRTVVVHCALGRGRSVFVMAAYLLMKDASLSVRDALKDINDIRATANLNKSQLRTLERIHQDQQLVPEDQTWMIINPVSGGGKWEQFESELLRELSKKYRLKVLLTTESISAARHAQEAISKGAKYIIAGGGDGTLTEVAGELVDTDIPLGMVPLGTANSLCHAMYGIESKVSPVESACAAICDGEPKKMDTAYCNDQLLLMALGIGLEQQMVEHANREEKNKQGQWAYLDGFFDAMVSEETQILQVSFDGKSPEKLDVHSFVIANAAPFSTLLAQGGEEPKVNDHKLHVTYLEKSASVGERLFALSDLAMSGLGLKEKASMFKYAQAKKLEITSDEPIEYVVDGENYTAESLSLQINPSSLWVFMPPK
ncbi:diacylglycerol kinase family protein [Gracilimonas mengyeensis]|uniref:Diacylglycerol kinase family enzyme n=1 Tax=Gracilimonas mengyeensis TaxID=1302730 RepID=A0A521DWR0_9BACT|nr:diacylglycerol kinase family protein [Gracilimonas mengyeensis]SMO76153.1 Diacylglycerol kinase family enzyme [Gracilimonas mengyeensis]